MHVVIMIIMIMIIMIMIIMIMIIYWVQTAYILMLPRITIIFMQIHR